MRFMLVASNRQKMSRMVAKIQDACNKHGAKTRLVCDSCCSDEEIEAYVIFLRSTNVVIGSVIHICPLFFAAKTNRFRALVHELGRCYNSLGESNTDTWHDVYLWDDVLTALCNDYDLLKKLRTNPPKRPIEEEWSLSAPRSPSAQRMNQSRVRSESSGNQKNAARVSMPTG